MNWACDRTSRLSHERFEESREQDRRPRRGHVQPCLSLRGAAGGDRAQARARDGGAQVVTRCRARTSRTSTACSSRRATASGSPATRTALADELAAYLLEHARRERLALLSRPVIEFETDERLGLGEFGIQTRVVQPDEEPVSAPDRSRPPVGPDDGLQQRRTRWPSRSRQRRPRRRAPDALLAGRRQAAGGRPGGRDDRAQPPVRRRRRRSERVAPARRDAAARRLAGCSSDLGSTNGSRAERHGGSTRPEVLEPGGQDRARHVGDHLRRGVGRPVLAPVSVGLKFGFLVVLYLFLMWVALSALRRSAPRARAARSGP